MNSCTRARLTAALSAIAVAVSCRGAQQPGADARTFRTPRSARRLPVDPLITVGTLPNGLRYYIRANKQPQDRAELRLVVNAGSVLEDDDQRGLAHFVEHMSFNGTKHFPKQDVVGFMQSLGMRFGAHVNAYTSFDETVYMLQVPTDKPEVIDRSLLILEDWAHNVSFDPAEIDKERGVILEEWRLGLGAGERIQDKQFPILLKGSRYAERLPIGKPEIIQNVKHDRLKQFYTDWYRPDLMAVIAVGDFDKAAIEAQIKSHFGSIPAASSPKPRPAYAVPDQPGTRLLGRHRPGSDGHAHRRLRQDGRPRPERRSARTGSRWSSGCSAACCPARLDEIAQKPNAPFLGADTDRGLFVRTEEATTLDALVADGRRRTRPRGALHRGRPRRALRLHRDGAESGEAESAARSRAMRSSRRTRARPGRWPTSSCATSSTASRFPGIVYEYALESALPAGDHARRGQRPGEGLDARSQPRSSSSARPRRTGRRCRPRRSWRRSSTRPSGGAADGLRRHASARSRCSRALPSPGAVATTSTNEALGHHRVASCPTASGSCSSRRRSSRTRSCSGPSAPAARRSRATRTSSRQTPPAR